MRRSAIGPLLLVIAAAGCGKSPKDEPAQGASPGEKRYAARLVESPGYAYLDVSGMGALDGRVPDRKGTLSQRVVGSWGSGYATEDYPSSYIFAMILELRADGTAEYHEEEGSEHFGPKGEIRTSMHTSKGPWEGTWTVTGRDTIEILLRGPPEARNP
jgi:hypothetical protein